MLRGIRCGGPSRVVPKRRPRFTRDMAVRARAVPYGARKGGLKAVGKLLMTGPAERELETVSAHRGSHGASLKHRARDAGEPGFLR